MKNTLWTLCLALFAGHELDAVAQSEWRLLYGLRHLDPALGQALFIALHVPLVVALIGLTGHSRPAVRRSSRRLLAGFAVVHAGLHFNLREHPLYRFESPLSQALIFACAGAGLLYLLVDLGRRDRQAALPLTD
ncbi:uncharacterized protein POS17_2441 [Pseudomonas sp. Os17]|uniref:DUF6713 family protein n=1 Tax=Pseudomonas sp. Os17 TaxID=1500686 RepID=UPI0005FC7071|nr:DUF6713 family protein [Pseudomonas sp. Os17]BAQ74135.1 uncharacterized protein POS17_2441 [Pseudomonas sp. Os17]